MIDFKNLNSPIYRIFIKVCLVVCGISALLYIEILETDPFMRPSGLVLIIKVFWYLSAVIATILAGVREVMCKGNRLLGFTCFFGVIAFITCIIFIYI